MDKREYRIAMDVEGGRSYKTAMEAMMAVPQIAPSKRTDQTLYIVCFEGEYQARVVAKIDGQYARMEGGTDE